jgi:hypothetical protein
MVLCICHVCLARIMINKCKMEAIRAYKEFVHWYGQKRYYTCFPKKEGCSIRRSS